MMEAIMPNPGEERAERAEAQFAGARQALLGAQAVIGAGWRPAVGQYRLAHSEGAQVLREIHAALDSGGPST